MALFDLLGRSWALGAIWQLSEGPMTFRGLQNRCETVSPTVLNRRLQELRECGIVERCEAGYRLSPLGEELFGLLKPFGKWSTRWAESMTGPDRGMTE